MLDKELKEYLIINSLKFSEIGDNLIEIDSKKYYYHNVEVPLIDDEGELILDIDNTILKLILTLGDGLEGIIYKFGPFFLYTKLDALCNVDLEEFKYLGEINEEVYFKSFLGVHGVYERMTGIGEYSEWVKKAKFLGYDTLAICERGTLGGVLQFQGDCQKKGIKPIIGYSLPIETPSGNKTDLKLYVKTAKGWSNLLEISKSLTTSELNYVELSSISKSDDLICVFEPGEHLNSEFIDSLKELFSEVFIQISNKVYQSNVKDKEYLLGLKAYIESEDFKKKVKPVLIHDAYCLDSNQTYLRKLLNKQGGVGFQNMTEDHYFKSSKKLIVDFISLFNSKDYQTILKDSIESIKYITDNCNFIVEKGKLFLPKYEMSEEQKELYSTNNDLFIALLKEGFARKIKDRKVESQERMITELQVIKQGFIDYFLILWDICNWCRQNGIQVGPGRGSAGGSIVSYLLGITDINPLDFNLLFERFLNESRIKSELPDIDIDFASDRRDEVIDYMRSKYGEEYVCRVGTYNTLQLKGALQELERYYGNNTPGTPISLLTKEINTDERNSGVTTWGGLIREGIQSKRFKKYIENNYEVVRDCKHVLGCIKSISIHPCATIIMPKLVREEDGVKLDLFKQIPVRQDGDTIVSEWEGGLLADIGYLKEDILSTKQMAKFGHILSLIKENTGRDIDVSQIPLNDEDVLELFRKGNNQDVFHFGSPGLTEYLKILKPYSVEDLIAAISLYRPGVMASGTHMKFVKLKNGEEEVEYEHPLLEEVTQNTLGLYIYQEQIMKIAQVLGGFSLVEADGVRKAMGKMDKKKMDEYKVHFVQNAQKNNCSEENALRIWNKMEVFSGYGFNKSHATAYSVIGYQCNWLKYYFPLEFWTVALEFADKDNVPMMVAEINSLGSIKVKAPDINQSERKFYSSKEDRAIYWNFSQIAYMGEASVEALINDRRQNGKYYSFDEFNSRVGKAVKKTGVINCILSGCFDIIEKIKKPSERYRLIKQYLTTRDDFKFSKEHKVELKELKDKVDRGEESIQYYNDFKLSLEESYLPKEYVENKTNDYYWILKQSEICKLSLIDYETLVKDKLGKSKVLLEETFNKEVTKRGESYFLPGLILETNLKKTKTGKDYLVGKIQQGPSILQFRMWEEAIEANNIELLKEGALVILDGKLTFNDFFMCNEFLVQKFTTVL